MDANLTREHLARLLAEENRALDDFESLLEREHAALKSRDIDAIEMLSATRQANVTRMLKLEDERRDICGMLGYETDLVGLAKLIAWCDPHRTLTAAYEECATRARRCRDLNDRNGILVGAQMKRVEGLLGAITGTPAQTSYGPRHAAAYGGGASQMISAEA